MNRKCITAIAGLILLGSLRCGIVVKDIHIPRSTIQKLLDKKFPYDKNAVIARFVLDSAQVYFKDKNIGMKLSYYGNFLNKEVSGIVDFKGSMTYKSETGAFYLSDFDIVDIRVNQANFSHKGKLRQTVRQITNNYLSTYPVYRLNQKDFKQNITRFLLKKVRIQGQNLIVTVGL